MSDTNVDEPSIRALLGDYSQVDVLICTEQICRLWSGKDPNHQSLIVFVAEFSALVKAQQFNLADYPQVDFCLFYLTQSVFKVVLQRSIPTQIRQLVLCICNSQG